MTSLTARTAAGQVIVGGFDGVELPGTFRDALRRGERGGAVLFRRNIASLDQVSALNRSILEAAPPDLPPLIAVDQEGGRVARLGAPLLRLPPMRSFGLHGDARLVERCARALGGELAALGFNMTFAPVLDVDTCATNPIIGDRSFSPDPAIVAALGHAWGRGLQSAGVMACGKHFPGHGDTTTDSHLELPRVEQPRARLDAIDIAPFRSLRSDTCAAVMTAHVVYPALDPDNPATLSSAIATDLLRSTLGFDGFLVSDDLEMRAIADRLPIEESTVLAVRAGCDMLLICASEALQERAVDALAREADRDSGFHARLTEAAARGLAARTARPPVPTDGALLSRIIGGDTAARVARELVDLGLLP